MISTHAEFEDETAWERTVLSVTIPLMPLTASGADLDLQSNVITIGLSDTIGGEAAENLKNKLLPLLFGSSWKILDLALELALALGSLTPQNGRRWLISEKSQHARAHAGTLPGFALNDLWQAYGLLYAETEEIRNALVHRRVGVDPNTHDLIAFDKNGAPLPSVTFGEQSAFCRFAQRFTQAITEGLLRPRVEADMRTQISVLKRHHGVSVHAPVVSRAPVRVIDNFPANGQIDVPALMSAAQRTFPGATYIDVLLHLSNGKMLLGELDSAPYQVVAINVKSLPAWLRLV